jgi:hypothetical protein
MSASVAAPPMLRLSFKKFFMVDQQDGAFVRRIQSYNENIIFYDNLAF